MTLKSLFSKEFWARLLRRFNQFNWLTAIWSVVLFFVFPVAGALVFSSAHAEDYWTVARVSNTVMVQSAFACGASVLMAILTPNAFNYLNSRRELDFYHSQPVTRKELFWRNYFTGWMSFIIPLAAGFLCEMGIIMLIPGIGWDNFVVMFNGFFACVGTYFSVNVLCLLAVMLCGNRFISLLTGIYFCGAPAMLFGMVYYYIHSFSATFRYNEIMENILVGSSPLAYIFNFIAGSSSGDAEDVKCGWAVIAWTVISVGILFLARGLYLRRKSESAGKPLSFPKAIIFIKYPLTIFAAWVGGILFEAMTESSIWMLFAFVTFGILTHCIISGLEKFEFRNAFRGWLKLLLCAGIFILCILLIFVGCQLFDRRTTKDENIVSIDLYSIFYSENANNGDYYDLGINLENIQGEDAINALNAIAKIGSKAVTSGNGTYNTGIGGAYAEVLPAEGETESARAYISLYLRINTRVGSYTREYSFHTDVNGEIEKALRKFASSAGAKKSHAEYLLSYVETDVEKFSFRPNAKFPSSEKMEELYEALKADMAAATVDQYEQKPVGYVTIHYSGRFYQYMDSSEERTVDIPVYSFYKNTLALAEGKMTADNTGVFDTVGVFTTNDWYSSDDYDEGYKAGEADGYERGKDDASSGNGYYEAYPDSDSEYDRGYYEGFIFAYERGYTVYGDPYSEGYEVGFEEGKAAGQKDAEGGFDITIPNFDYNGTDYRSGYIEGFNEGYLLGYKDTDTDTDIDIDIEE